MAQETEETLRIILLLGQATVPAARDALCMMARAVSVIGRRGAAAAHAGADAVTARVDGMGRRGVVRSAKKIKGPVQTVDVTDKLDRADIHELGRLCRSCGVGFAVTKMDVGGASRMALQFSASDASTMEAVLNAALASRLVDDADLSESCAVAEPGSPSLEFGGEVWRRSGSEYRCDFKRHDGADMSAFASPDGSWRIVGADGQVAMSGPEMLSGKAGAELGADLGGALTLASANMTTLSDAQLAMANQRWRTSPSFISGMRSADVIKAASDAVDRKNAVGSRGLKPGAPRAGRPSTGGKPAVGIKR